MVSEFSHPQIFLSCVDIVNSDSFINGLKVHSHLNVKKSVLSENIGGILGGTQC